MPYFLLQNHICSRIKQRIYSSSKTQLKNMSSKQNNMQLLMSNIQNKITLYVNFNKHKREYIVIPIIPIGAYFYIQNKTTLLITLLAKNIQ